MQIEIIINLVYPLMQIFKIDEVLNFPYERLKLLFDTPVVIPTETVYGLAGVINNDNILSNIYQIKGRPSDNPLIVHISNLNMLKSLIKETILPEYAVLIKKYWPGPLTLIFKANDNVSNIVKGNHMDTIAIRMPNNSKLLKLIDKLGIPLAAPSANTSGQPSPTEINHVLNDLGNKVETYIDDGKCLYGLESTILSMQNNKITILRPGIITKEEIEKCLQKQVDLYTKISNINYTIPGMKYTHYSPKIDVYLFIGKDYNINMIKKAQHFKNKKIGIMGSNDIIVHGFKYEEIFYMGKTLKECASNCFSGLRHFEKKVDLIFIKGFPCIDEGVALMDRLEKASNEIIE